MKTGSVGNTMTGPYGCLPVPSKEERRLSQFCPCCKQAPPNVLFEEVRDVRRLLTPPLERGDVTEDARRQVGWLSALLGNLASGARTYLATAAAYGARTDDRRLEAWAWGAQSMVARADGHTTAAVEYAERGAAAAPAGLVRAQLNAWALLPPSRPSAAQTTPSTP